MFLVIGRTASGKDTFARMLTELGLKQLRSYTTRAKRTDDEDTHTFVDETDHRAMRKDDSVRIVAETTIDGNRYWATDAQVHDSDIYVIDPEGALELIENMPDEMFTIVNVTSPAPLRHERFLARQEGMSIEEADELYRSRMESEDPRFDLFEKSFEPENYPDNVLTLVTLDNRVSLDEMRFAANELLDYEHRRKAVCALIKRAVDLDILERGSAPHTLVLPDALRLTENEADAEVNTFRLVTDMLNKPAAFAHTVSYIISQEKWQRLFVDEPYDAFCTVLL